MLNVIATLLAVIAVLLGIIASTLLFGAHVTLIGLGVLAALALVIAIGCGMTPENRLATVMFVCCLAVLAGLYVYNY